MLKNAVGVVARNSIDYVADCFRILNEEATVVPLRSLDDQYRIQATKPAQILTPDDNRGWFQLPLAQAKSLNAIAQVSFTSGTEGKPKGVLLSRGALDDVTERLKTVMNLGGDTREYIGIPVYHSFGYGRCRLLGELGAAGYIPPDGFDPSEIARMLEKREINSLSAVPSLLRVILKMPSLFTKSRQNLRWLEIGSQVMSGSEKEALRELFPEACIVQHYGLTEASRSTLLEIHSANRAELDSVGKVVGRTELNIDASGHIQLRGPHLASGLLIDGQIRDLTDNSGWFTTQDLGRCENGHLFFEGRADNQINCGGQKTSAERLEKTIASVFGSSDEYAVARIPHPTYGEGVLLAYSTQLSNRASELREAAVKAIASEGISATGILTTLPMDSLPKTDTGKVQRAKLSQKYADWQSQSQPPAAESQQSNHRAQLEKILRDFAGSEESSLKELGIDSIRMVEVAMLLEKSLGQLPTDWRERTATELNTMVSSAPEPSERSATPREVTEEVHSLALGATNRNPTGVSFFQLVREDYRTHESQFFSQGFWAIFVNRFGNWRMSIRSKLLRFPFTLMYRFQAKCVQIFCGIKLDYTVKLGRRIRLEHFGGMILGAREIGNDVTIRQNTTMGIRDLSNLHGKPRIEDGVNIGAGAVIVGDIVIGRYSVVGPNVVVDRDVPPFSAVRAPQPVLVQVDTSNK